MTPHVTSLDHLVLTVADVDVSIGFYVGILGMSADRFTPADGSTRWALSFGTQKINLHQSGAEFDPKAGQVMPGSADLCFLSETSLDNWQDHLKAKGVAVEEGPIRRTGATGPILSIYLRDPDGNLLEISNRL